MKKAMKKIVALALSSMTALSVFAASPSAALYFPDDGYYWCDICDGYHNIWYGDAHHYGYYSQATITAYQYKGGAIKVTVPSIENVTDVQWSGLINVDVPTPYSRTSLLTEAMILDTGNYSATCKITFKYQVTPIKSYTDTVTVNIFGTAYENEWQARRLGRLTNTNTEYGKYWNDWYWNNYPWYDDDYWYPSYSYRNEYTVDWSTDTYYYDGEKHVPTATVTVGKRTIELNVSLTSGNGIDVGKHRVVARVPSGYSGIKLDGASLYYNIEEPLKSGFVYEDGYTYYYEGGKAVTGWKTISGDTYYFAKDGKATKGWKWLNNAWYYFGSDGKMMTEWVRDGGKIYYCYDSGVMAKSTWLKLDGYWYYFYNDGRMAESEWVLSGGKWYFLAGDGRMATNTTIPGGYYVDSTGAWVK